PSLERGQRVGPAGAGVDQRERLFLQQPDVDGAEERHGEEELTRTGRTVSLRDFSSVGKETMPTTTELRFPTREECVLPDLLSSRAEATPDSALLLFEDETWTCADAARHAWRTADAL